MRLTQVDTHHTLIAFYRKHGINIIPLGYADKRPDFNFIRGWQIYQVRQASDEEISRWWPSGQQRLPNIGVITGCVSNNLAVIDIDNEEVYRSVISSCPEIGNTATVRTGNGYHLYFQLADDPGDTVVLTHELGGKHHFKANGSYVVAPPSLHPSGKRYTWLRKDIRTLPSRSALLGLAEAAGLHPPCEHKEPVSTSAGYWEQFFSGTYSEGGRHDALVRAAGFLRNLIRAEGVTRELMLAWNSKHLLPPLDEEEVSYAVRHIYRRYRLDDAPH